MQTSPFCFVVMPFRPELNYFYLYLQDYLHNKHGLHVERGDHEILTKPLMEKIREQVIAADVILADISGSNPNVFYELGLAHALGKPVIFLTQEPPNRAPVDIRQFEFIQYDLAKHQEFLANLDKAIASLFVGRYQQLYNDALELLHSINRDTGASIAPATLQDFQSLVVKAELVQPIPSSNEPQRYAEFLLPRIVANPRDVETMKHITAWIGERLAKH